MDATPCPPYYAEPTHEKTLLFYTASYVRNAVTEDWYQCVEGAYCNAPSFLGYNPPGEGSLWTKAWDKLDEGYPCNPDLETSSIFAGDGGGSASAPTTSGTDNNISEGGSEAYEGYVESNTEELKPTNQPTRMADVPSLISGMVWYDANGDGRKNTLNNAISTSDKTAAKKEMGAGLSNMKVTLRECQTDKLLGITYTFPQTFGSGEGGVQIVESSYIDQIQAQEAENTGFNNLGNDGLGIGNDDRELGYYSFRILPFQLPGDFYVVFESPAGYRLSGGSGSYWEVYEAALYDAVQPSKDASWLESKKEKDPSDGELQKTNETATEDVIQTGESSSQSSSSQTVSNPMEQRPKGPINHSGYYARSNCISIQSSPTRIGKIDAGFTQDSWPLLPYQYASLVVTVHFYSTATAPPNRRRNDRRRLNDSLECRKYEKLKSDGVEVEDIWGCEGAPVGGAGAGAITEIEELTEEEADMIASTLKEFLDARISRAWAVKFVAVAHQEVIMTASNDEVGDEEEGGSDDDRRKLGSSFPPPHHAMTTTTTTSTAKRQRSRGLQRNSEIGVLELGFRIRAEYNIDKSEEDLGDLVGSSMLYGGEIFLSRLKGIMSTYFKAAGIVTVRDILWKPEEVKKEISSSKDAAVDRGEGISRVEDGNGNEGISTGALIGIIVGSLAFVGIIVVLLLCRRRKKKKKKKVAVEDGSSSESLHPPKKGASSPGGNKKWWQRKKNGTKGSENKKKVGATGKKKTVVSELAFSTDNSSGDEDEDEDEGDEDEDYGDDYDDDYSDDLSSRFYSDSSKFDPEARRLEVGGYGDDKNYDVYNEDLSSRLYSDSSDFSFRRSALDGSVYSNETGSQSYYTEGTGTVDDSYQSYDGSSYVSGSVSRKYGGGSFRSSATSGNSSRRSHMSMRSSATSGSRSRTNRSSMKSNGSTIESSMRSSGRASKRSMRSSGTSNRRTGRSSMRSSGKSNRTSGTSMKSAADLYNPDRLWSASKANSSGNNSRSTEGDDYSESTRDSRSRVSSHGSYGGRSSSQRNHSQSSR